MAQPETDLVQSIAKWLQHFEVPFASSVLTSESSRRGLSRLITSGEAAVIVLATIFENDISSEADRQQQESQALYNRALTVATNARSHREAESNIVNHPGSTTVSAHSVNGSIRLQCWATAFALLEHLAGVTVNVEEREFIIVGDFGAAMGFLQRLRVLCDHAVIHLTPQLATVLPSAVIHAPKPTAKPPKAAMSSSPVPERVHDISSVVTHSSVQHREPPLPMHKISKRGQVNGPTVVAQLNPVRRIPRVASVREPPSTKLAGHSSQPRRGELQAIRPPQPVRNISSPPPLPPLLPPPTVVRDEKLWTREDDDRLASFSFESAAQKRSRRLGKDASRSHDIVAAVTIPPNAAQAVQTRLALRRKEDRGGGCSLGVGIAQPASSLEDSLTAIARVLYSRRTAYFLRDVIEPRQRAAQLLQKFFAFLLKRHRQRAKHGRSLWLDPGISEFSTLCGRCRHIAAALQTRLTAQPLLPLRRRNNYTLWCCSTACRGALVAYFGR
jgi:hypothetical protein